MRAPAKHVINMANRLKQEVKSMEKVWPDLNAFASMAEIADSVIHRITMIKTMAHMLESALSDYYVTMRRDCTKAEG